MRLFRTRLHAYITLVFVACVVTAVIVVLLLPPERVTRANFEKIELGMSTADVQRLLGRRPNFEMVESGIVRGPAAYSMDFDPKGLRQDGYQDYKRQQWDSPDVIIVVVSDATGRIVCRYTAPGEGRRPSVFETAWYWIMRLF